MIAKLAERVKTTSAPLHVPSGAPQNAEKHMGDRLFVAVLGNRNSGKSTTWNSLFGRTVKTGKQLRHLTLRPGECVEVFLVSGSFEERKLYAGDMLEEVSSKIVLCSMQYTEDVIKTLCYATENKFDLCVHWLNPGYSDRGETAAGWG